MRAAYLFALALATSTAWAGPLFDDLLNYAVIDQQCPRELIKEEGLGLATSGRAEFTTLTSGQPLGQTFRTGPEADQLWRVCVGLNHWPGEWETGEAVTFTLWDSPEKGEQLYSRTVAFEEKWHKWDTPFDIYLPTRPETDYYFELTHNGGGDDAVRVVTIPGDEYPRGRAYRAGEPQTAFDLYFVVITKPKRDREENLRRFLNRFDLARADLAEAREAKERGDLDLACRAVLRTVEAHLKQADWVSRPVPGQPVDTRGADLVVAEGRLYKNHDTSKPFIAMNPRTTWREVWPETSEYVRYNDLFNDLGYAYAATGDERYAAKLNELLIDHMQDNASPFDGGMRGGRWVAMFIAWRLGDGWDGFVNALDSSSLLEDTRLGYLDYEARMAHFAVTEPSGGNHANAVAEAVMQFALRMPHYAQAQEWFDFAFNKLVANTAKLFYPDGACVEPAMNYHGFSLANLISGLEMANKTGMETPADVHATLEKALVYTAYMLKPDGQIPTYGDTNCEEFRLDVQKWNGWRDDNSETMRGYRDYGRQDLLYIATEGRQGTRPPATAYAFPDIGHYVMRSDWGGENGAGFDQARWLFFRAGRMGSHGHWDLNMITFYAYGRPLLIDPGRTTYGTPLMTELTSSRSHNVLLVEGAEMQKSEPRLHAWHHTPVLDLIDNAYDELYPGVDHRRAALFVRPDYVVLFDHATAREPRSLGVNFWLTPPDVVIDTAAQSVTTSEPAGANLLLRLLNNAPTELVSRHGTVDLGGVRDDIPVVTWWQRNTQQADFAVLLLPFPAGAPVAEPETAWHGVAGGHLCVLRTAAGADYVFYARQPTGVDRPGQFAAHARAAVARVPDGDATPSYGWVDGVNLSVGGTVYARSAAPIAELAVRAVDDTLEVVCKPEEPSLELNTFSLARAIVNGKPSSAVAANGMLAPFAAGR